ncbi:MULTISPECIES: hypoxanthine phosphoribosyltransferase [Dethiosulfovibrio]|jgi:hypoxanthine phosphoribosyltransferase|uniref:Hypoxanthine phosphoribosyltransferase n=2 Tax=Dethiosulfovibrio TaxID=47054 RepID=A0ABS9EQS2_9BACT|nr:MULTISPECIES: hypoxanthine phosphoribosyltransferase [Dethiosulfovibrio]MCF4113714.1 hypoxanthine phosphoribosyltransferase [Dethiosulfovibrio russensis]MCF4143549.1 hypoxanthine phosphoribosyltransferase [Dethiosulfovibrio marinus]MCF4145980.1 hypoxanthine phosphoribosyltransferase [Dethiosulfovibrio acidaminovorans]
MDYEVAGTLIDEGRLARRVAELGKAISVDYNGRELIVIGILRGAVIFMADLVRAIDDNVDVSMDFISVSSYGDSTKSSGVVRINKDLDNSIKDKDVLIVEDIVDTGLTLSYLRRVLMEREPKSLAICSLLDKKERRIADISVDYVGFDIPDLFVVGYGLDYAERWRNLRSVHSVEPTVEA